MTPNKSQNLYQSNSNNLNNNPRDNAHNSYNNNDNQMDKSETHLMSINPNEVKNDINPFFDNSNKGNYNDGIKLVPDNRNANIINRDNNKNMLFRENTTSDKNNESYGSAFNNTENINNNIKNFENSTGNTRLNEQMYGERNVSNAGNDYINRNNYNDLSVKMNRNSTSISSNNNIESNNPPKGSNDIYAETAYIPNNWNNFNTPNGLNYSNMGPNNNEINSMNSYNYKVNENIQQKQDYTQTYNYPPSNYNNNMNQFVSNNAPRNSNIPPVSQMPLGLNTGNVINGINSAPVYNYPNNNRELPFNTSQNTPNNPQNYQANNMANQYNNQVQQYSNQNGAFNYQESNVMGQQSPFSNTPFMGSSNGIRTNETTPKAMNKRDSNGANTDKCDNESEESSSDESNSDHDKGVTDKGEEIFTLIKKTYNRIDMNKIPRPIINFQDKKNKPCLKIFETCKYISPPSFYQPFISVDTGKADPRFIKSTLYQIPLFSETLNLSKIPFGIIVNPFARLNDGENVCKVHMKDIINDKEENVEILRCPKCFSYIHGTMLGDLAKKFICVFCDAEILIDENVLFDIYQYNEKMAHMQNSKHNPMSPLLKGSVDIMIPSKYYTNSNNLKLSYTSLNKNVNQTASIITNKIMSITKQISNTLVSNDSKNLNNQSRSLLFSENEINYNNAGAGVLTEGGERDSSGFIGMSRNYINEKNINNNETIINENTNFRLDDIKNLLNEKKGETYETINKRNSILSKYKQIKNMLPPYFVFVIDCSYNAIYNNITYTVLEGIKYAVKNVTCPKTKIAIITYSNSLFFFNCKYLDGGNGATTECATNADPNNTAHHNENTKNEKYFKNQLIVMSDIDDPFVPLSHDDIFLSCVDELDKINNLIDTIKTLCPKMQAYGSCGNSALKAAIEILKERNGVGSISMFYTSTPNCGIGAINEIKRTPKENLFEVHQKSFYDSMLLDLYNYNISTDVFIISANNTRICVPTLQYVAQNTGGKILFLENFIWQKDYKEIYMNIKDILTSEDIAYCCELKLRYSQNISVKKLFCCNNNFNSIIRSDTIKIPKIRHDQTFGFLLNYSDISDSKKQVYIQCACIYTNLNGDRYVRLHTTHMNVTSSLSTAFRYTDAEALMNILIKQLCMDILHNENYSKNIIDSLTDILFSYRINCASSAHSGQLILPDTLKLLPLFTSCILKHNIVKKEILPDLKIYNIIKLLSMPIISSLLFVYPITYIIHIKGKTNEIDSMSIDDELFIPRAIPSSGEKIYSNGIYLIDVCSHFYLFFGYHSDMEFASDIYGDIPTNENCINLTLTNSPNAKKFERIIMNLSKFHHSNQFVPIVIVPPNETADPQILSLCVEDKVEKEYSYVNFLCFIHKLVHKKIDEL
ncbi:protein transport protein Sec24B, putative [Plasmodium chabaudi chabaudi]|uniref:Protein transport protein Sec24B, putative n=1 Tax=Plasmodium chabaudi chabaudi TaxID=31271 RepID=A0A4V0K0F1_PLACU|nr:protein transport protein Sec24B, putative [Plasmodium chabaudi chabaudi]VTZ66373.1 protein transport protein Sec24B, putative [Plasmodium chabaudi chabaudi]|eukprot:XP_016655485.1 protein transport protein Sec24B, putative [Plasmodium chabaudi chabaudi]